MNDFLVAYDIFDKKRLVKIKRIVYSYALGGQKSALDVPLTKTLYKDLLSEIEYIAKDEDKINIISIIDKPILLGKAKFTQMKNNGVIII